MQVALKEPTLVRRVEQWAQETKRPAEKVLEIAVQAYLDELEKKGHWVVGDDLGQDTVLGRNVLNQLRVLLDGPATLTQLLNQQ